MDIKPLQLFSPELSERTTVNEPAAAVANYEPLEGSILEFTAKTNGAYMNGYQLRFVEADPSDETIGLTLDANGITIFVPDDSTMDDLLEVLDEIQDALPFSYTLDSEAGSSEITLTLGVIPFEDGIDGVILKTGQAVFDDNYVYFAVADCTVSDSSGMRKMQHTPLANLM